VAKVGKDKQKLHQLQHKQVEAEVEPIHNAPAESEDKHIAGEPETEKEKQIREEDLKVQEDRRLLAEEEARRAAEQTGQVDFRTLLKKRQAPTEKEPEAIKVEVPEPSSSTTQQDFRSLLKKRTAAAATQKEQTDNAPSTDNSVAVPENQTIDDVKEDLLKKRNAPPEPVVKETETTTENSSNTVGQVDFRNLLKKRGPPVQQPQKEPEKVKEQEASPGIYNVLKKRSAPVAIVTEAPPEKEPVQEGQLDFRNLLKKRNAPPPEPVVKETETEIEPVQVDFRNLLKKRQPGDTAADPVEPKE